MISSLHNRRTGQESRVDHDRHSHAEHPSKSIALLVSTFDAFSGIDRVVELQAIELAGRGHHVTIIALAATMPAPRGTRLLTLGLPSSTLLQRLYRLLMFLDQSKIQQAANLLRDTDIVYSHQYPMNLIALEARKRYGSTFIYYDHGLPPARVFGSIVERVYIILFRWFAKWTVRRADRIITISYFLRQELQRQTGKKAEVIYDRIDERRYHRGLDQDTARRFIGIDDRLMALFVGRLSPHKGVHLLLQAWSIVFRKIPNVKLVIVGKATFPRYLRKLHNLGKGINVLFTGVVSDEDLPRYFAACDIYVTASLWEGFNLPMAEAHACGKPIVAFDVGPHREIARKRSRFVAAGNITELAHAIIAVFEEIRDDLSVERSARP